MNSYFYQNLFQDVHQLKLNDAVVNPAQTASGRENSPSPDSNSAEMLRDRLHHSSIPAVFGKKAGINPGRVTSPSQDPSEHQFVTISLKDFLFESELPHIKTVPRRIAERKVFLI